MAVALLGHPLPRHPLPRVRSYQPGARPPAPRRNFTQHWQYACEGEWRKAFLMFSAGARKGLLLLLRWWLCMRACRRYRQ